MGIISHSTHPRGRPEGAHLRGSGGGRTLRSASAALLLLAALSACAAPEKKPDGSLSATLASPRATATVVAPRPSRLVGDWVRTDSPYVVSIAGFTADGKLSARYLNPRPINVSRAEWKQEGEWLRLLVELRDLGYPGSYYELTFDPESDALFGVYHHLGLNQDFAVSFSRQPAAARGAAGR